MISETEGFLVTAGVLITAGIWMSHVLEEWKRRDAEEWNACREYFRRNPPDDGAAEGEPRGRRRRRGSKRKKRRKRALEVLGLPESASEAECRRRYRELAMETHPDRKRGGGGTAAFREVNEAWKTLQKGKKRGGVKLQNA